MTAWYQYERARALETVGSSGAGLTADEAARRLEHHGRGELPETAKSSRLMVLFRQFVGPLILVLLVAAAATRALGEYIDTGVVLAVTCSIVIAVELDKLWHARRHSLASVQADNAAG